LFGDVRKRGDWEVPEHLQATAIFGSLKLDFREARISAGVTTIHVSSTFASVQIIVPPGLRIECDGSAIMGEFSERRAMSRDPGPGAPTLRIVGMAVFGSVEIKMKSE
jgi:predicted membrane protein